MKALGASILIFLSMFGLTDVMWTMDHRIKWMWLYPNADWMALQNGVLTHVYVLAAVSLICFPLSYFLLHRNKIFDVRILLLGIGIYWIFNAARVAVSPSPGYTDWGFLIFFHPELQKTIPVWFVFFTNDIMDRMIVLWAMIWSAASFGSIAKLKAGGSYEQNKHISHKDSPLDLDVPKEIPSSEIYLLTACHELQ